MRVLIDDHDSGIDVRTVGEAIAAGATLVEPRGRLIVEVVVDGDRWPDDRLASPQWVGRAADEVSLVSADLVALVRETFGDAAQSLLQAAALQTEAAELIQTDQIEPAMERLASALTIWSAVHQAVEIGVHAAGLDLDRVKVGDRDAASIIGELQERLGVVRSALQQGDPIELADTLLYDLPDVVSRWRELLQELQRATGGGG